MHKFTSKRENYEDYSSGRVLYGTPEATNFSVHLANEIFLLCSNYLSSNGKKKDYRLYDPFCGSGYSLTVLGLLHGKSIAKIFASDAYEKILEFANKNLSLLTLEGLHKRMSELNKFIDEYGKDSHRDALVSAQKIENDVKSLSIDSIIFKYNVLEDFPLNSLVTNIDMVITDIPYGKLVKWDGVIDGNPVQAMLNKIKDRLNKVSFIAVVSDKKQEIKHDGFQQVKKFKVGKRKIILLTPIQSMWKK